MDGKILKTNVKYLRKTKGGYTQAELADLMCVSRLSIIKLEKEGKCSLELAVQIAKHFNVSMDDLLFISMEKKAHQESVKRGIENYLNEIKRIESAENQDEKDSMILQQGKEKILKLINVLKGQADGETMKWLEEQGYLDEIKRLKE